jgi:hypothetical protein
VNFKLLLQLGDMKREIEMKLFKNHFEKSEKEKE